MNETEFPDDLSEEALAHTVGSSVRGACRRGVALDRRRVLMAAWADYLGLMPRCDKGDCETFEV